MNPSETGPYQCIHMSVVVMGDTEPIIEKVTNVVVPRIAKNRFM